MRNSWSKRIAILLTFAGLVGLGWTGVVWLWQEPVTSLYTAYQQRELSDRYDALAATAPDPPGRGALERVAARFRRSVARGDPIGRLRIDRLQLDLVLLNGTDPETLKNGPGRDHRSFMPGEGRLVYVAGHRTTYSAPFGHIEQLRPGDRIELEMPYGHFRYEVTGHRIVDDQEMSVLRSPARETLRLQACHPRFFATQRYIVFAKPVGRKPASRKEIA